MIASPHRLLFVSPASASASLLPPKAAALMGSPPAPLSPTSGSYSVHLRRRRGLGGLRRAARARGKMKLMYFLMDREEQRSKRQELEFEVSELETVLDKEKRLTRILHCSLQGRVVCHCCLSALVPTKIRGLLAELAIVEDEIFYLEKKVDDLRLRLHRERKWTDQCILQQQEEQNWPQNRQQRHPVCGLSHQRELQEGEQFPRLPTPGSDEALECESKASVGSGSAQGGEADQIRRSSHSFENLRPTERRICLGSPNKLSEELIRLMITIFHKLNKTTDHAVADLELSSTSKLNITSCIGSSRSLVPKPSSASNGASPICSIKNRRTRQCVGDGTVEETGDCKRFVEFTRSSFDASRISLCLADIKNLRGLMQKLCSVDPSFLTNKQKLAFWLNIYNFCVMHAFLQHGVPPSPDKLVEVLNQASVNVGGTVLNVLSIERLFLRHCPEGNKQGMMEEEQVSYGLGYPEPNVVFALCRGSRSSPAVRVYRAEDVCKELERAKVEYLETWVRVARKKRVVVLPKLLQWHMRCFADDVESLLEWVYSQLPRSRAALKRAIRDLLLTADHRHSNMLVEIEPYHADFRYLLPTDPR